MNKRLRNVKLSIFDPEKKKWQKYEDMTVLITEDFIYAIKSEPFYNTVDRMFRESKNISKLDDWETKNRKFNELFNDLLERCPISEELQGLLFSGKHLWKIEMEDKPYFNQGGDIG